MTVNERVRYLRKGLLHLNQTEFGRQLHLSQNGVSWMERGVVTDRNIAAICKCWGVREQWLRTGEGDAFEVLQLTSRYAPDAQDLDAQLAAAFLALDSFQRKRFKAEFRAQQT